jgi:hypothetical protein
MSKTKGILALILAFLSVFFGFQYQNVLAADSQQAEIINQIRLIKVAYNTFDPLIYTGTKNGGFFECNFTIENLSNHTVTMLEISSTYLRKKEPQLYIVAQGVYVFPGENLSLGNRTFTLKMNYVSYTELPPDNLTTPLFWVEISVKYQFSARNLSATASDSAVENNGAIARPQSDETYTLLFMYSALIISAWVLGMGAVLIVMLSKAEKTRFEVERLAGLNFLLLAFFIFCLLLFSSLPYPPPYMAVGFSPPATGGIAGLHGLIVIFLELTAVLNTLTAIELIFHQRWARILMLAAFLLSVLFLLSVISLYGLFIPVFLENLGNLVLGASFIMVGATTAITIFNLLRYIQAKCKT